MTLTLLSLGSKLAVTGAHFGAAALVLLHLTPAEQGYYYTFVALVALQTLFELGLGQVLVVFLAHECSDAGTGSPPHPAASARARAIARASLRQYARLAAAFAVAVCGLGLVFFGLVRGAPAAVDWLVPWLAAVAASALRLPLMWLEAVLEGIGRLPQVLLARIAANAAFLAGFWIALRAGAGLATLAVATLALVLVSLACHAPQRRLVARFLRGDTADASRMDWRRESRSMQRRVAGTWIASYAMTHSPIPIALALIGAAEAGLIGVAFQFAAAVGVIAGALISPRLSQASRLVANGDESEYARLLRRTLWQTAAAGGVVAAAALAVLVAGPLVHPDLAARLPSLAVAAPLLVAALVNSLLSCIGVFARARKRELFVRTLSVVAAVTAGGSLLAQGAGGLVTIAGLHLGTASLITAPAVWLAWRSLQPAANIDAPRS